MTTTSHIADHEQLVSALAIGDSFRTLVDHWLAHATTTCGRAEAASLRSMAGRLKRALADFATAEVTPLLIRAYLRARLDAGLSLRSCENHLKVARRIMEYACRLGIRSDNPARDVVVLDDGAPILLGPSRRRRPERSRARARALNVVEPGPTTATLSPTGSGDGPNQLAEQPMRSNASPSSEPKAAVAKPETATPMPLGWHQVRLGEPWAAAEADMTNQYRK